MKVTLGTEGLKKSWQKEFPEETQCVHCDGMSRIGFVAHEADDVVPFVRDLHENNGKGGYWLHDACAVAVYFCKDCLNTTALYNQA